MAISTRFDAMASARSSSLKTRMIICKFGALAEGDLIEGHNFQKIARIMK